MKAETEDSSMGYKAKDYRALFGIERLSDRLLQDHLSLYQGYVARTNTLDQTLHDYTSNQMRADYTRNRSVRDYTRSDKTETAAFEELKRRFAWEFNGMRLHEYYFGCMTNEGRTLGEDSALFKKILEDFGTYDHWEIDFKGVASMRGIGWAVLSYDSAANRLHNIWIGEHDQGHLVGAMPILVLDVFEHAYLLDYGIRKAQYVEAFFGIIDWRACTEGFGAWYRDPTLRAPGT